MNTREKGTKAEQAAAELYEKAGYEIVAKNWHFHRIGEIDLIVSKNGMLVFVEVKCRKQSDYSVPSQAVTQQKRNRIRTVASAFITEYMNKNDFSSQPDVRFDVAEVTEEEKKYIINIIRNAF